MKASCALAKVSWLETGEKKDPEDDLTPAQLQEKYSGVRSAPRAGSCQIFDFKPSSRAFDKKD